MNEELKPVLCTDVRTVWAAAIGAKTDTTVERNVWVIIFRCTKVSIPHRIVQTESG